MSQTAEKEGDGRAAREDASLDLAAEELDALAARSVGLVADYLARASELPVFPEASAVALAKLFRAPLPAEGDSLESLFDDCDKIFAASRNQNSPRMFGYVASPAAPVGAYAALLTAALNQNVTSWRSSPAATEIEKTVVNWLAEMVGFVRAGAECGGLLTSGGSAANLTALLIAHRFQMSQNTSGGESETGADVSRKGLWGAGAPSTLYVSDQVHLSIPKAAGVLGLGREQVRVVGTDERFRMDVRDLRERIEADGRAGLRPFCVVASAGTVASGAVDPLAEVARVAREHDLWFHVDGAYGALAALDAGKRPLFEGIERADSISLDPHKWLYAPLDCGCLLMRDPARARFAFGGSEDHYIKVYERDEEAFAFWDYGIELSRPFRALKVWMMLRYYGARKIAAAISEDNALAQYMSERIETATDFEPLAPVTLSICCFRYVPEEARRALLGAKDDDVRERINARLDHLNERVMYAVQRGGEAYISNATLRGRFSLRASITNFRTTRADVEATLEAVRRAARVVQSEESNEQAGQKK